MKYCFRTLKQWGTMSDQDFLEQMDELGQKGWRLINVEHDRESDGSVYRKTAYFSKMI